MEDKKLDIVDSIKGLVQPYDSMHTCRDSIEMYSYQDSVVIRDVVGWVRLAYSCCSYYNFNYTLIIKDLANY